ncbi:MAG: SDR family oxidoreductase [Planctomycetes bacterium]|nr:SDR family oxidoreductase [Planctomycetota bacterium]
MKCPKTLVVGASGATGRLLLEQLLDRGGSVRAVVRAGSQLPVSLVGAEGLEVVRAELLELGESELQELVEGCDSIASCLGHNLTFRGLFGQPCRLVTESVRRLTQATIARRPESPVRFVLMNTTGNRNRDLQEPASLANRAVIGLLRTFLPPHADNEQAADYLRTQVGQSHPSVEWAAVRPDGLINAEQVTPYDLHPSPTRDPIFDAGQTSRINVASFMADLATDDALWAEWKGRMPVIYNRA